MIAELVESCSKDIETIFVPVAETSTKLLIYFRHALLYILNLVSA